MLAIGIVGLPNVGKSTLFNAITNSSVPAENYPFCTIEPNVGIVEVKDERLVKISEFAKSKEIIYSTIKFVDIAGLVKGASQGQGLGNKFLSHIREAAAICHVLKCFDNANPVDDFETIVFELICSDIESVSKAIDKQRKVSRDKKSDILIVLEEAFDLLNEGKMLHSLKDKELLSTYNLLTVKPFLIIANVNRNENIDKVRALAESLNVECLVISAQMEYEISRLDKDDRQEFLKELGVEESGLDKISKSAYKLLGLISYFTAGKEEARSWTIRKGESAYEAAAVIHTDIQRGFIRAEVTSYSSYLAKALPRLEGKNYVVQDGDVIYFRFAV